MRAGSTLGMFVLGAFMLPMACVSSPPTRVAISETSKTQLKVDAQSAKVVDVSLASVGIDGSTLDRSVNPCEDFYAFVCGNWLKNTVIPAEESVWLRTFYGIRKSNETELRRILEQTSNAASPSNQLTAFYAACMDEGAVEMDGKRSIEALLAKISALRSEGDVARVLPELHKYAIWAPFRLRAAQDSKDATRWILSIDQAGLALPNPEMYSKQDARSEELKTQYVARVTSMFELLGLGETQARAASRDVLRLEIALAKASKTLVELRDPRAAYNKTDRASLERRVPNLIGEQYFAALGYPGIQEISLQSPKFIEQLNVELATTPVGVWRNYLTWHVVHAVAPHLSHPFQQEAFAHQQVLTGQSAQRPRWQRCLRASSEALGDLLSQQFVRLRFSNESKQAVMNMATAISSSFGERVSALSWMDGATRQRALQKLGHLGLLMGYPEKWKSYSVPINPKSHPSNFLAAQAENLRFELNKVGKPVDHGDWPATATTVDAFYDGQRNHMVFPAGILQPPLYHAAYSLPVNFGGIGFILGHEVTHGFDSEGAQYDARGNLVNWWRPDIEKLFKEKGACVRDQYSRFEALPGLNVNGSLTLAENIADIGGVNLALQAYRKLRQGAVRGTRAEGFSEEQQFFLAFAQNWCTKFREQAERLFVETNTHSLPRFRVNGSLMNTPAFAEAFSCEPGTKMRPSTRCEVW